MTEKTHEDRVRTLETMRECLLTPSGEALVDELEIMWDSYGLMGDSPEQTGHNVGLRDAYKFIKQLQKGVYE